MDNISQNNSTEQSSPVASMPQVLINNPVKTGFSKSEAINFGFNTTKANFGFIFKLLLILAVLNLFPSFMAGAFPKQPFIVFVFTVLGWFLKIMITIGTIKISLKFVDNQKPELSDIFSINCFWSMFFGGLLYGIITAFGFILLIIPGIIFGLKLQFYTYLIVEKCLGPIEALKQSWGLTKGQTWNLFLFVLLLIGINILGALVLFVGLLFSIPTTMLAAAFVYRKLASQTS